MAKRFYLDSLGCKVNSYEVSLFREPLRKLGMEETDSPEEADYIILNGCAVTARSVQKGRQRIRKLRRLAPRAKILAMGCLVKSAPGLALELGADYEIPTKGRNEALPLLLEDRIPARSFDGGYEEALNESEQTGLRAYLKVQDGCSRYCSYCLIPYLRGPSCSRKKEDCLREAEELALSHPEIVVTGIEVAFYGKDLGDGSYRLSDLLEDILSHCPSLRRLRLSSLEEGAVDEKMLSLFASEPRLCSHVHLALQSGCDKTLRDMGRPYDQKRFLSVVEKLRKARPGIAITTDVIVGFPGESEEDFEESLSFCRKVGFAEIHAFPYSVRKGTKAASMAGQVDASTKKEREHRMLALSKELRASFEAVNYGTEKEVLLESYDAKGKCWSGHTSDYLLVKVEDHGHSRGEAVKVLYSRENAED